MINYYFKCPYSSSYCGSTRKAGTPEPKKLQKCSLCSENPRHEKNYIRNEYQNLKNEMDHRRLLSKEQRIEEFKKRNEVEKCF